MSKVFQNKTSFNQKDLSRWEVEQVKTMEGMFWELVLLIMEKQETQCLIH